MANFAVAASFETIEFTNKVMDQYMQDGDKKEDALIRIFKLAESEAVKGTHPELEESLRAVDSTIDTLIKQINGVVAGQDVQISDMKKKLDEAIDAKYSAMEESKIQMENAKAKEEQAKALIEQAKKDIEESQKKSEILIDKANYERDQALRERDDARVIAEEKTSNNDLLMRQMSEMKADVEAYKKLLDEFKVNQDKIASLTSDLKDAKRNESDYKKECERLQNELNTLQDERNNALNDQKESQKTINRLESELKDVQHSESGFRKESERLQQELDILKNEYKDTSTENKELSRQVNDLKVELQKSVMDKEHEMQEQIRSVDKENAKLTAKIEQLEARIAELKKA